MTSPPTCARIVAALAPLGALLVLASPPLPAAAAPPRALASAGAAKLSA
jgi:hypothetical protein